MTLTLQCETCLEGFTGGFGYSLLWSAWHDERHKQEAKARRKARRKARWQRVLGWLRPANK